MYIFACVLSVRIYVVFFSNLCTNYSAYISVLKIMFRLVYKTSYIRIFNIYIYHIEARHKGSKITKSHLSRRHINTRKWKSCNISKAKKRKQHRCHNITG